jgi:hypothetical protein
LSLWNCFPDMGTGARTSKCGRAVPGQWNASKAEGIGPDYQLVRTISPTLTDASPSQVAIRSSSIVSRSTVSGGALGSSAMRCARSPPA